MATFINCFITATGVTLHSFKMVKTPANDTHILLKFMTFLDTVSNNGNKLQFFRFEDAFVYGLCKVLKISRVAVSFLNLLKLKDRSFFYFPKVFLRWQSFTHMEVQKSLELLISQKGCAFFLANYISFKLAVLRTKSNKKRQVYFLTLVKMLLNFVKKYKLSAVKGIKILIKGRLNGSSIAKKWLFLDGVLSLQQIEKKVDFHYTPSFTVFGILGVKVWIHY